MSKTCPFEEKVSPAEYRKLGEFGDPSHAKQVLGQLIDQYRKAIKEGAATSILEASSDASGDSTPDQHTHDGINQMQERLSHAEYGTTIKCSGHLDVIIEHILDLVSSGISYTCLAQSIINIFEETETLADLIPSCKEIIMNHNYVCPESTEEAMEQIASHDACEQKRITEMAQDVIDLINSSPFCAPV